MPFNWDLIELLTREERGARGVVSTAIITIGIIALCCIGVLVLANYLDFSFSNMSLPEIKGYDERAHLLFYSPPSKFQSIIIDAEKPSPYLQNRSIKYFHGEHFEIVDPDEINKIILEIRKAKPVHLNHPQSKWSLRLTLHTNNQNIVINVHKTKSLRNGTYFHFPGRGDLRSDGLSSVLVKLLYKQHNNANSDAAKGYASD